MSTVIDTKEAKELQRRNRELAALNAISLAASRSLNLGEMLDFSLAKILEIIGGEAGCVLLVEAAARRLSVWGQRGLLPELAERFGALTLDGEYWQQAASLDITNLWRISEAVKDAVREAGLAACALLPLRWRDVALGITLLTGDQEALGQWSMEFLMTVSDQLSVAVRNAQLYREAQRELAERQRAEEEIRRRSEELSAINTMAATVSSSLNLQEIMARAIDKVLEVARLEVGAIFLLDQQADELVLAAYEGVPRELADRGHTLPVGQSLAELAMQSGEPIAVADIATAPRLTPTLVAEEGIRSFAAIPIKSREKMQGMMYVASHQYHPFSPEEVRLYTAIANQIGVAIEKARLYELAQQEVAERKLAEEALRESEERYRRIFEYSPIGVGLATLDGQVINANRAMQAITGYTLEELQKTNLAIVYERIEDRQALHEAVNRYGGVVDFPARLKRKDGTPYDALLSVSPISLGGKDFYHTMCQDITERQRAAETLRQAHAGLARQLAQLSALADLSRFISSTLDLQEILKTAVERTAQAMKARIATIRLLEGDHLNVGVAVGYREPVAREHPIPIDQRLEQIVKGGQPLILPDLEVDPELPLARRERMRREGVRAYLGVPMMAKERAIGILSVYRPEPHQWLREEVELASTIANQVAIAVDNARLYQAIAEAKRQLENITGSIADGLYTTDRERRIITFNAAAEAITGWRAAEVLGRFCGDVFRMEDETGRSLCCSDERCSIYRTLQQGYTTFSWGEKRFIFTKSGEMIPVATIASPLLDDAGQVVGAVAAFWNASRETKLEQLDQFLSMVSHELLTPLTNIKTAAQLSLRRFDTLDKDTQQEILERIAEQCNRLISFAEKTLRISYLKMGLLAVERQPFACLPLLEKAVSLYRIGVPGCQFEVWAQGDPWAIGDEAQTAVVLNAILENAVKYSPQGGTIRLDVAESAEDVLISIADQGRGISPQEQAMVFDKFYRGHTNMANGYGLGLYLAKMLVEAQGGRIWLESELGKGTQVHFALPKAQRRGENS